MICDGKASYYVIDIIRIDGKNGERYIDKNGKNYQKIKCIIKDAKGETENIYYSIYNRKALVDICKSIGDSSLIKQAKEGALDEGKLIGKGGECLIVSKYVEQKNRMFPAIVCWINKSEGEDEESF